MPFISEGKVHELIRSFLTQGVMESHKGWEPTEQGTPQGAVVSPLLSNIYLNGLDQLMARKGYQMVRYADDCAPGKGAYQMRAGPSQPACGGRLQTTVSGWGKEPWS